jgi:hypothetical protein
VKELVQAEDHKNETEKAAKDYSYCR